MVSSISVPGSRFITRNSTVGAQNASLLKSWASEMRKATASRGMSSLRSTMKRLFPLPAVCMATALAADIPIREVILYKSGVGYFERAGALSPGESARLDFKATAMNDALKSLTLQDRNGGKVTGLRYDSREPLDQKLAEVPFKIDGAASLSSFLDQVKGARVEMKYS